MKAMLSALIIVVLAFSSSQAFAARDSDPYIGNWALTIPGGGAGWLGVTQERGYLDASILWGGGSVVPVASVYMDGDALVVTRLQEAKRKDAEGKVIRTHNFTKTIVAHVSGDELSLTETSPRTSGKGVVSKDFSGKRIPPLPPRPELSKVTFGAPITLFNGTDLSGWELTNPRQANGWSAEGGILINDPVQEEGKRHVSYGNLRTVAEFEDFNLSLDAKVDEDGNSGIYLRGIYEIQVAESYGKEPESHMMGAVYSRIAPSVNPAKPAGQWQAFDITLVDRHLTVKLNGTTIIDNEPLLGCTGGALWSDEFRPGPIYLKGDHTGIQYRNIVLKPVEN